jgi:hypothetical protein
VRCRFLLTAVLLVGGCSGRTKKESGIGVTDGIRSTWACNWIALAVTLDDSRNAFRVEVPHTLSIEEETLNDDLPYRLADWAAGTEDGWRATIAYGTGFVDLGRTVAFTMDDVPWTPTGDDEIMFEVLTTGAEPEWGGNAFMTFKWTGDGAWIGRSLGFGSRSWCVPAAP